MKYVEVWVTVHQTTDDAVLISDSGDEDDAVWIPRSQIHEEEDIDNGDIVELSVAEWIAKREGLI